MARIAYLLLCHKDPAGIIAQVTALTAAGDYVAIHLDGRAPLADYAALERGLAGNPNVCFSESRISCGWGDWSLVAASLATLRRAMAAFPEASHFYLLSGDCMPIKSAEYAHAFLDAGGRDYIESVDFFTSDWIRTGIKEERLIYRHYFNERRQSALFYGALALQKRLGLRRALPQDLDIQIGSQWWCLRRETVRQLLEFIAKRPDVTRFFRRSWIPDETFFQTLVRHLVPGREIESRPPTFLMFSDYGMPVCFYDDHYDMLLAQDYLFARKISPDAQALRARLGALYASKGAQFAIADHGRNLYRYIAGLGREGRRFTPRFWEGENRLSDRHEILVIAAAQRDLGRRLAQNISAARGIPALGYAFNDEAEDLPDLGGIGSTLDKRTRHRRAVMKLLFDHWQSDRVILCIDPASIDLLDDLAAAGPKVRVLELEMVTTDAALLAEAQRRGLVSEQSPESVLRRVLPLLRADLRHDQARIAKSGAATVHRLSQAASGAENCIALAGFLAISEAAARPLLAADRLFDPALTD